MPVTDSRSVNLTSDPNESLLDNNNHAHKPPYFKQIVFVSVINGVLYLTVAIDGGDNARALFNLNGHAGHVAIFSLSIGASLVYTMFTYKTLESLSLKINSFSQAALAFLAPFSAAAFLTAGKEGAELLHCDEYTALTIGVMLFILRMLNSVDASVKFPDRLIETKTAWNTALDTQDYAELGRLITVWLASLGYVLCTTDAIYSASEIILSWFGMNAQNSQYINFTISALGAVGTLPLNVYWSHRGLRQLTNGGQTTSEGKNPDPTDRYTFIALICVLPVILGILGGATASTGKVFGQLGESSLIIRIISSVLYATFAGTPGMASLLRETPKFYEQSCHTLTTYYQKRPWLKDDNTSDDTLLTKNCSTEYTKMNP
ncbi:MAG: hypothetical protein P1U39_03910 [Legionellaceae bacterium]|nr:hypothetical protein [Legionellaceae bacterium]